MLVTSRPYSLTPDILLSGYKRQEVYIKEGKVVSNVELDDILNQGYDAE